MSGFHLWTYSRSCEDRKSEEKENLRKIPIELTADANSVLGWLYRVDAEDVTSVSELHDASIFRVEVLKLGELPSCVSMRHNIYVVVK
jgi:hypothetical protein